MKKRIIALFMAIITVFSMLAVPANAASLTTSGSVTIQQAGYGSYLGKSTGGTIGGGYWKHTSNTGATGTAYCVNRGLKGVYPSRSLTIQEYNREPKTMGAFANGYPNRTLRGPCFPLYEAIRAFLTYQLLPAFSGSCCAQIFSR